MQYEQSSLFPDFSLERSVTRGLRPQSAFPALDFEALRWITKLETVAVRPLDFNNREERGILRIIDTSG